MSESAQRDVVGFVMGCLPARSFITSTLVIMTLLSCSIRRPGPMIHEIPEEIDGWTANSEVREYDRKTLFKYINGGAELYLAYRFHKAYVRTYTKPGEPDIIMDIYDMGTPEDAFGVFTAEREGDETGIGTGSEYEAGLLRFAKARFFISIMAREETPSSRKAVLSLGKAVADRIQSVGEKPELLSSLPDQGLIEHSIRYFYDHNILNLSYYLADDNILHIDSDTKGVLARYHAEEEEPYLLLVKYPSNGQAKRVFGSFLDAYMPDAVEPGLIQTEDGKWTAADVCARLVVVVLDAPSAAWAHDLLEAVRNKQGVKP